jgi:carbamoyltransferase
LNILGIGGSEHDFSACLIVNGEIVVAIEDERLSRVKHSLQKDLSITPLANRQLAIEYCLDYTNLTLDDIDLIITNDCVNPIYLESVRQRVVLLNHHLTHAASAYYPSPYTDAAIMIVDGIGSIDNNTNLYETITLYSGKENNINLIGKVTGRGIVNPETGGTMFSNSLGRFYYRITTELGFSFLQEGKTMGLAPYGKDCYVKDFADFYSMDGFQFIQTHTQKIKMVRFIRNILLVCKDESSRFQAAADIAYAGQYHLEQILIKIANELYLLNPSENLCIAGGVGLNSVANYKIQENTPFKNVFIQPASGDAGTAIGAALYGLYKLIGEKRKSGSVFSPYLGKKYSRSAVKNELVKYEEKLVISEPTNIYEEVAQRIAQGKIVSWFNGKSEIGPRALGNRSILVDPRRKEMKDILNSRVKHREFFRPFAPIILEEHQREYFDFNHPSYYMLFVPRIFTHMQLAIPAVTHVDGTGRMQTISNELNPELYKLLSKFYDITKVPVLLNTSFNDKGEPIVESPSDALKCFLNTDIDCLAIEGYLVEKTKSKFNL